MWIRFNHEYEGNPRHAVVDVGVEVGEVLIENGVATRCTGPDGVAFGEAAPEDVQRVLDQEE